MARRTTPTPTGSERKILEVLWQLGPATVREVTEELSKTKHVAYTTVLTILRILDQKGYVTHEQEGRTYVYQPAISRDEARSSALKNMLAQFFDGSPSVLAKHLLREHEVDWEELEDLREQVKQTRSRQVRGPKND